MSQLRLYSVKTGAHVTTCAGCAKAILPCTRAVMREDRAVFCSSMCALEHDDAQLGVETWQVPVATEAAP